MKACDGATRSAWPDVPVSTHKQTERDIMKWETPKACDYRFGFEITMYIATR
jgi:pyrroloquinoline quinone biosynthesis protein A